VNNTHSGPPKFVSWNGEVRNTRSASGRHGRYYLYGQNDTLTGAKANITCAAQTITNNKGKGIFFGDTVATNCSGDFNLVSAVVDYARTKHFDTYIGANYSEVNGGLASGNLQHDSTLVAAGVRLKF